MKKWILLFLGLFITVNSFAGTVSLHTTYSTNSQVTSTNLNGNNTVWLNALNGGLDNDNANTSGGYRFYEVRSSLPTAGTEGRTVFLTTDDTLNFDTGAAWTAVPTISGTPAQGDIIYYNGSNWVKLTAGTSGTFLKTQGASANPTWANTFLADDGSVSAPGLSFLSDADTGFYRIGANNIGLALNATKYIDFGIGEIWYAQSINLGTATTLNHRLYTSSQGTGTTTYYIGNQSITTSSDKRLKTNIEDTKINALDKLGKLRIVDFNWNDPSDKAIINKNSRGRWTGMIAQETIKEFPYIINAPRKIDGSIDNESKDYWYVDYGALVPALVKGIQELSMEVDTLKKRIEILENR